MFVRQKAEDNPVVRLVIQNMCNNHHSLLSTKK